jgi:hypothetical protein
MDRESRSMVFLDAIRISPCRLGDSIELGLNALQRLGLDRGT